MVKRATRHDATVIQKALQLFTDLSATFKILFISPGSSVLGTASELLMLFVGKYGFRHAYILTIWTS